AGNPKFALHCRWSDCELRVQSGTRIIELPVSRFRSSHRSVRPTQANFGIGTLAPYDGPISGHRSRHRASVCMIRFVSWLILACALAGVPAQGAEPVFPLGLRIGLVPPPGLVASTAFQGFEDRGRNVAMIVTEMPPEAFAAMDQVFTIDALKSKGIEAERREPVTLTEGRGFIVVTRQQAGGTTLHKWV